MEEPAIGSWMNSITALSADQLRRAAKIKEQLQSLENELGRILGSETSGGVRRGSRKMSAAARAKIAAAQRARWAKQKGRKTGKRTKRTISAAGRAKIAAGPRARCVKMQTGTQ